MSRVGVGFRVRSGRAIAVLMAGSPRVPELVDCRIVLLSEPAEPASNQPYHAALREHRLRDMAAADRLVKVVERATRRSVTAALEEWRSLGRDVRTAVLVVGSLVDPATIRNEHMRAHALEGRLFRTALEDALAAGDVRSVHLLERRAYADVAAELSWSVEDLKRIVTGLGRGRGGPWRADEKLASVAALQALAG